MNETRHTYECVISPCGKLVHAQKILRISREAYGGLLYAEIVDWAYQPWSIALLEG